MFGNANRITHLAGGVRLVKTGPFTMLLEDGRVAQFDYAIYADTTNTLRIESQPPMEGVDGVLVRAVMKVPQLIAYKIKGYPERRVGQGSL